MIDQCRRLYDHSSTYQYQSLQHLCQCTMYVRMTRIRLFLTLLFVLCCNYSASARTPSDPYHILGVSASSSTDEIQKQYRKKCLQYHPDKNVHKSKKEREKCEEMFKKIQSAYHLIGSPEAKRKYDMFGEQSPFSARQSSPYANSGYSASAPYGSDPVAQAFFRAFQQGGPKFFYYSNGKFGVQTPFQENNAFATQASMSFKSVYKQTVKIPLEDLYKGVDNFQFKLVDNLWTRVRAAIRGKVMLISFYQGLIYSLPILRASRFLAFCMCIVIVSATLPKPDPSRVYKSDLRPGLKGGEARVKFASTSFMTPEVIFEIQERPHKRYKRIGNDLHTQLAITPAEAKKGCTKSIASIDQESTIQVEIKPNKMQDGDEIRIVGKGWPIKNSQDGYLYGDMVVRVRIEKRQARRKRKQPKSRSDAAKWRRFWLMGFDWLFDFCPWIWRHVWMMFELPVNKVPPASFFKSGSASSRIEEIKLEWPHGWFLSDSTCTEVSKWWDIIGRLQLNLRWLGRNQEGVKNATVGLSLSLKLAVDSQILGISIHCQHLWHLWGSFQLQQFITSKLTSILELISRVWYNVSGLELLEDLVTGWMETRALFHVAIPYIQIHWMRPLEDLQLARKRHRLPKAAVATCRLDNVHFCTPFILHGRASLLEQPSQVRVSWTLPRSFAWGWSWSMMTTVDTMVPSCFW